MPRNAIPLQSRPGIPVLPVVATALVVLLTPFSAPAQERMPGERLLRGSATPMSIALDNLPYPHPVQHLPLTMGGEDVRMAYMDVQPGSAANGRTVVLLHGYNFFGEYWAGTIAALRNRGFRVVVPDQIGFGRSSKPVGYYSFHQMAAHTKALLDHLGIEEAAVVGHSMGGMLATRFALMYPEATTHLVLVNMVGMEDSRTLRPWRSLEEVYQGILNRTDESVRAGQERYYVEWRPEFEKYVQVHLRWALSTEWPRFAMVRALTSQMMYEQPVVYEFPRVEVPTYILGGAEDGPRFREIAAGVAEAVPDARLLLFDDVGHNPHLEAPDLFFPELVRFLLE
jgi:pimeloyl-ACP methyl ester carboxylesterase